MAGPIVKLFGFELRKAEKNAQAKVKLPSIVPPIDDDGAGYVTASGSHTGQYIDFEGDNAKGSVELVQRYRAVGMHPEVDMAIDEICNEAVSTSELEAPVKVNLDKIKGMSDKVKKQVFTEFDDIVSMLNFSDLGSDMFKRWYIDGRMVHHLVVNEANLKAGIQEIRPIDATKIRKVKEIKKKKDPTTNADIVEKVSEFFVYEEKPGNVATNVVKINVDAISYVTSGLLDEHRKKVVSYLHKALKPINQLRMMEDSLVIYRLARAPERRIFYVDVGNLPRGKAEEYMKNIMARYKNKIVYDATTGEVKDDRKHMSMLEDFWLPRREGGKGTEISTLNVPVQRLEQESTFQLGRSSEISREELKFQKFIDKLRRRFSSLFLNILKKQLLLKQIIVQEDWDDWKSNINIDFVRDNHFTELKETEILQGRLGILNEVQSYAGEYFSKEWIMKNVLHFDEQQIKEMGDQIGAEIKVGEVEDPKDKEDKEVDNNNQSDEKEDE